MLEFLYTSVNTSFFLIRAHYDISLSFLQKELLFDSIEECRKFLQ
jgi:hypothetical protein